MRLGRAALVVGVVCAGVVPAASAMDPLPEGVIAPDVSVDGVPVGGMTVAAARALNREIAGATL